MAGMKIAILGFDTEGRTSYEYFMGRGDAVTIYDQNPDKIVPEGADARLGDNYLDSLDEFDLLVRTPGLHPSKILEKNPEAAGKVTSATNEFFLRCPTANIIGVTGTKGKGTTSTLIAKMLKAAGHTVHLGGNIGVAMLSLLPNIHSEDWVVLELSSFQLIDLQASPPIAVCLMMAPEHQDWHRDVEEYYTAKEQLFARQTPGDIAVFYHDNEISERIAGAGQAQKIPYCHVPGAEVTEDTIVIDSQAVCSTSELKMLGKHNWQNACAAVTTVWQITQDIEAIRSVLTTFGGLPYRVEFRSEVKSVRYYNDSFASAPPAPLAALQSISGQKVLILGGFDRGLDLNELAEGIAEKSDEVRSVLLIGAARERLATVLREHNFNNFLLFSASDMKSIVQEATRNAQPGDAIILSPGFPSFDMFKNFEDRGRQFNEAVEAL